MECSICYIKSNEEEDPRVSETFVTLPCESAQKHVMCFKCFITNHVTTGKCPVCRSNYMEFVQQRHDIEQCDAVSFADNLSSPRIHEEDESMTYESEEDVNRCIICGVDMGIDNPRQYCEKTHCPAEDTD